MAGERNVAMSDRPRPAVSGYPPRDGAMHHADPAGAQPSLELGDRGAGLMQLLEFVAIAVEAGAGVPFFTDLAGLAAQCAQFGVDVGHCSLHVRTTSNSRCCGCGREFSP